MWRQGRGVLRTALPPVPRAFQAEWQVALSLRQRNGRGPELARAALRR
jgi:hypothetical protein